MQRPSYEPFDPQQNHHAPAPYGNVAGAGGGYPHAQHNQQHFGQQHSNTAFSSRFEVDQSVDNALSMLTNPDILSSLTSMVQQPLMQQQQHAFNMPQQPHHHIGAYPSNAGPAPGMYTQRPNAPSYPPSHAMQGSSGIHDSRGHMFDGGSQPHMNRAMDAPPTHHTPNGNPPLGAGALTSRDSFPLDSRGGHLLQQRPGQYPPPPRPDYRQPVVDNRTEYRGMEGNSYIGNASAMQSSRAEREVPREMLAHLQGGRDMGGGSGGTDAFGRRGPMDYRHAPDMNMGVLDAFGGHGGAAQSSSFRGPAPGLFRPGDVERAPIAGNYNYREMPANDFRGGGDERRVRDDGRLPTGGGSLLDAYSSGPSRNPDTARYGAPPPLPARSSLVRSRGGAESLLDQYGGGAGDGLDHRRDDGRGGGGGNRWDDRRSPSPSSRQRAVAGRPALRDTKFGLSGRTREAPPSTYSSSRFERRRSRSPADRRAGSRGGDGRSPKDRGGKGDEEVPPTKELFVGSIRDGTTEAHVLEAFSKFGPIDSLAVKANRHFGFVNFKNLSDAVRAKREMEGKPLATSIKLSIQFTKVTYTAPRCAPPTSTLENAPSASALTEVQVDTRRGGDDGRPERRIEREPIEKEQHDSLASVEQMQHHSDASSSQERGASSVPADVAEGEPAAVDEASPAAGELAADS